MPGVQHAGFGSNLPPRTPPVTISVRLVDGKRDETRFMKVGSATPGYLRALGARFIAGRDFEDGDYRPEAPVVILSESVARFYFRDRDPIGRTITQLPAVFGTTGTLSRRRCRSRHQIRGPRFAGGGRDIPPLGTASAWQRIPDCPDGRSPDATGLGNPPSGSGMKKTRRSPCQNCSHSKERLRSQSPVEGCAALLAIGFGNTRAGGRSCSGGVLATFMTLVAERRRDLAIRSRMVLLLAALPGPSWGKGLRSPQSDSPSA